MDTQRKLAILADAAKYDASCASSGVRGRRAGKDGLGSAEGSGICHSYTPDGRCVSLLKVLLTNHCIFDCAYCINRRSSNVARARFGVEEIVGLTLDFYRRNYIEGLFLSSGIIRDADYTMERLVEVARRLRIDHGFVGYIHLKTIPEASRDLIDEAARWADRLSINVELPEQRDLDALAPEKNLVQIEGAMGQIRNGIDQVRRRPRTRMNPGSMEAAPTASWSRPTRRERRERRVYAPAGQSTQMVVGASAASDKTILRRAATLYDAHRLRRVYYSGYSPIPDASSSLPPTETPLVREHRLYQADWLLRFYGFDVEELFRNGPDDLSLRVDPKLSWALRNRASFPVDVNEDDEESLLRVPGLGVRNVRRILSIRTLRRLREEDLRRLNVSRRALSFLRVAGRNPALGSLDSLRLQDLLSPARQQLDLFASAAAARTGEL